MSPRLLLVVFLLLLAGCDRGQSGTKPPPKAPLNQSPVVASRQKPLMASTYAEGHKAGRVHAEKVTATRLRLAVIRGSIVLFRDARKRLPESLDQLAELSGPIDQFDSWNNAIHYAPRDDNRSYDLRSLGPDGKLGTEDDVVDNAPLNLRSDFEQGSYEHGFWDAVTPSEYRWRTHRLLADVSVHVRLFHDHHHRLPESLAELVTDTAKRHDYQLPAIDPWGNPLVYSAASGRQYVVYSVGADGKRNTDDDIVEKSPAWWNSRDSHRP